MLELAEKQGESDEGSVNEFRSPSLMTENGPVISPIKGQMSSPFQRRQTSDFKTSNFES